MISLPADTEMFQFPAFTSYDDDCLGRRVAPFGNRRFKRSRTTHRRLSQFATSFVASWCQGIHHTPLLAYSPYWHPNITSRPQQSTAISSLLPSRHNVSARDSNIIYQCNMCRILNEQLVARTSRAGRPGRQASRSNEPLGSLSEYWTVS